MIENIFNSKITDPRKLQQKAKREVSDEMLKESIQVTNSIEDCARSIEKYFNAGLPEFIFIAQVQKKSNSFRPFARRCCHILYPPKKKNNKKRKGNKYVEGNYRSTHFPLLLTVKGHNSSRRNIFGGSSSHQSSPMSVYFTGSDTS